VSLKIGDGACHLDLIWKYLGVHLGNIGFVSALCNPYLLLTLVASLVVVARLLSSM